MTRREEIQWEAGGIVNRMIHRGVSEHYDTYYQAFQDGAQWADKTMIEKACKWLYEELNSGDNYYDWDEFLGNFRKAMED